jgi:hypothetical protein
VIQWDRMTPPECETTELCPECGEGIVTPKYCEACGWEAQSPPWSGAEPDEEEW